MNKTYQYRCSSCGAIMRFDGQSVKKCTYCGSMQFIKETVDTGTIVDGIVPVRLNENKIKSLIHNTIRIKKVFEKEDLRSIKTSNLNLTYIPLIVYTLGVEVYGLGSNNAEIKYTEILRTFIDGNRSIIDFKINSIAPFNLSNLKKFNPSYLTTVSTQPFDAQGTFEDIKKSVVFYIKDQVTKRKNLVGSSKLNALMGDKEFVNIEAKITKLDEMKIYVPVWQATISSKSKSYDIWINDTNGNSFIHNFKKKSEDDSLAEKIVKNEEKYLGIMILLSLLSTFISYNINPDIAPLFFAIFFFGYFFAVIIAHKCLQMTNIDKPVYTYNIEQIESNILYERKVQYEVTEQRAKFFFDDELYDGPTIELE